MTSMEAALECMLFVSGEPVTLEELARGIDRDPVDTEMALRSLQASLSERGSGLQLLRIAGGWQLATRPEYSETVGRMLDRGSSRLSRAALETLAVIAYRQPVTAPEIEAVRGVSVSGVLKTLMERRLVREAGKKQAVGRPTLYATTPEFLHYFGITDLKDLPPLEADAEPDAEPAELIADGKMPE
jgi:segregation and condensation protein B